MNFDNNSIEPLITIHPFSLESLFWPNNITLFNANSLVWPTANLAMFFPFMVNKRITAVKMFAMNGATLSGAIDVGIYDVSGTRLISSGSTGQVGVSNLQIFDIVDTSFGPGTFYLAVTMNNIIGRLMAGEDAIARTLSSVGILQMTAAFPLPAVATFATVTEPNNRIPWFGLSTRIIL